MQEQTRVIGFGKDEKQGFKWYTVSEGLRKKDGQPKGSGPQVRVFTETYCPKCNDKLCGHIDNLLTLESKFDQESMQIILEAIKEEIPDLKFGIKHYFCMCEGFPHKEIECSHVARVKSFESDFASQGENLKTQREEEINDLQGKAAALEKNAAQYLAEKNKLSAKIDSLQSQLAAVKDQARVGLEKTIEQTKKEYEEINTQFQSANQELQNANALIQEEKKELETINGLLEERNAELEQRLDQEKKARFNAVSIAENLKRARSSYDLPKEILPYLPILAELGEEKLNQRLGDLIYSNIPVSKNNWKEKINLGKIEHHQPRRFLNYVEKKARIETIDQITSSQLDSAKETRFKNIYSPGKNMPSGQKSDCWTIHWIYSDGDIGSNLYFKTTARNQVEAKLIVEKIKET